MNGRCTKENEKQNRNMEHKLTSGKEWGKRNKKWSRKQEKWKKEKIKERGAMERRGGKN